jgi:hypothetical protein
MKYKQVPVSESIFIMVPDNLTPDEEANYIASRIAFVNLEELEADLRATLKLWEEGKMIPLEDLLAELAMDAAENHGAGT